ncbi:hypothetical protein AMS68_002867 [Peltaster fructicola]|uniref:AA1-like domain-containing protein n=1 Tax=Peltaster fructicola TaxID=286661 RepID=A0A6H0XSA3_9PEZI|nr:hypothetical protein AMS68_002867 [Peltaster fructicola]
MLLSNLSTLLCSLLAAIASAADVYANFVDQSSGNTITPAFDVSNPGCFNVDVNGYSAGVFFTQGGTSPGSKAHGPYCLYEYYAGGCPTDPDQLVYAYTFQDVPVNNQWMYYINVCTGSGQRSFSWSASACTSQGNLDGAFPPP